MLARFDTGVIPEHPHLVLWQVGTNSLLRDRPLDPSVPVLHQGIARLKAAHADVVLIDPQFAPQVIIKPDIQEVVDLIATAAKQEHVGLFHRFALMRYWHDVAGIAFETFVSPDGLHMNDWSYNCLAQALASAIASTADPGRIGRAGRDQQ